MTQSKTWNEGDTIIWYDLETSGINKAFDQPVQFAAIKTTTSLEVLDTFNFDIALTADVVPCPDALLVHQIPVTHRPTAISQNIAIEKIHHIMNSPNTINCGYNNLRFDDEFLRFCFYKHLYHPYTHQYSNGCKRFDLYPAVVYYYLFAHDSLTWPAIDNRVSLKLENLARHNLPPIEGQAHDALVDVKMTIGLAKKMMENSDAWPTVVGFFDKNQDMHTSSQLPFLQAGRKSHCMGLLIDSSFGLKQDFSSICVSLGRHQHYKNQSVWLKLDTHPLETFENEADFFRVIVKKKWGEPPFLLQPEHATQLSSNETKQQMLEHNMAWIDQNPDRFDRIIQSHTSSSYPTHNQVDLDAKLYDTPFFTSLEEDICQQFHVAPPKAKASLINQIAHPTLKEQGERYLFRYHPEVLHLIDSPSLEDYRHKLLHIDSSPIKDHLGQEKRTPSACLERIEAISHERSLTDLEKKRLRELEIYVYDHFIRPLEDNES